MPAEKVRKDGIQFRITRKSLFDGGYHFSVGHEHAEEGRRHARNLEKVLDLGIIPPEIESWLEMRSNKMGSQMTIAVARQAVIFYRFFDQFLMAPCNINKHDLW